MDFGLRLRKPDRDRPRITWKEVVEDINDLHLQCTGNRLMLWIVVDNAYRELE